MGVSFQGKFDPKINRSIKTPSQEYSEVACSYSSAPGAIGSEIVSPFRSVNVREKYSAPYPYTSL